MRVVGFLCELLICMSCLVFVGLLLDFVVVNMCVRVVVARLKTEYFNKVIQNKEIDEGYILNWIGKTIK